MVAGCKGRAGERKPAPWSEELWSWRGGTAWRSWRSTRWNCWARKLPTCARNCTMKGQADRDRFDMAGSVPWHNSPGGSLRQVRHHQANHVVRDLLAQGDEDRLEALGARLTRCGRDLV